MLVHRTLLPVMGLEILKSGGKRNEGRPFLARETNRIKVGFFLAPVIKRKGLLS